MKMTTREIHMLLGAVLVVVLVALGGSWLSHLRTNRTRDRAGLYRLIYDLDVGGRRIARSDSRMDIELRPNGQWWMPQWNIHSRPPQNTAYSLVDNRLSLTCVPTPGGPASLYFASFDEDSFRFSNSGKVFFYFDWSYWQDKNRRWQTMAGPRYVKITPQKAASLARAEAVASLLEAKSGDYQLTYHQKVNGQWQRRDDPSHVVALKPNGEWMKQIHYGRSVPIRRGPEKGRRRFVTSIGKGSEGTFTINGGQLTLRQSVHSEGASPSTVPFRLVRTARFTDSGFVMTTRPFTTKPFGLSDASVREEWRKMRKLSFP